MNHVDRNSAIAVLLLALLAAFESVRMGLTKDFLPDSGLFPLFCALGMAVVAAIQIATSRGPSADKPPSWPHGEGLRHMAVFGGGLFLYAFSIEFLGFALSTLIFLAALFRYPGRYRWRTTAAVSLVMTASLYLGLVRLLGVVLPQGFLAVLGI